MSDTDGCQALVMTSGGTKTAEGRSGGAKAEERRRRIVSAARTLFIANGFHATGVAQIAKASGVAVGQIYRDFASKEAIIAAIVEADTNEFLTCDGVRCGTGADAEAAAWAWLEDFFEHDPEVSCVLIMDIVAESARNAKVATIFESIDAQVRAAILRVVSALVPGDAADPARAAGCRTIVDLIMVFSFGLLAHDVLHGDEEVQRLSTYSFGVVRDQIHALRARLGHAATSASVTATASEPEFEPHG